MSEEIERIKTEFSRKQTCILQCADTLHQLAAMMQVAALKNVRSTVMFEAAYVLTDKLSVAAQPLLEEFAQSCEPSETPAPRGS